MRVISGSVGGYKLKSPEDDLIRPTSDRVKENLFNILAFEIEGVSFLDLFCGTGAIGIEALSRGARYSVFVDNSASARDVTNYNLTHTGFSHKSRMIFANYTHALDILKSEGYKFDIVFLDPPYLGNIAESALTAIWERELILKNGFAVIETVASQNLLSSPYSLYKERKYGLARLMIYRNE